ncbi:TIM-barrel domain-containing protein [uncultured Sphingomonas sp.]|uniref:glycoside hydrolase family 31 protein n=1 Tax=uncultured Sphingomonas sp. TaxID=158754 RepID=UPI0025E6CCEE|nr:TIM-barrel domain-containing protein [uncultured Sphingomonas sp.]
MVRLLASAALIALAAPVCAASYQRVDQGIVVTPDTGAAKRVRVLAYGDAAFRVTAVPGETLTEIPGSLMVTAGPAGNPVISKRGGLVTLKLAKATAEVRLKDGHVRFLDAQGKPVLDEAARGAIRPITIENSGFVATQQQFNRGTDEGFYGLGQHQNGQMNYNGEDVDLAQHNMDIAVPFVVSTRNYGLLWDSNAITRFGNPKPYDLMQADGGWKADYYLGGQLAVSRTEQTINYQYIRDQANWPAAAKAKTVASADSGQNTAGVAAQTQKVVWTGTVTPTLTGTHKLRLYSSSYVKVFADGREVLNRWRPNWNPWYHNFELPMTKGKPVEVRIEWEPNAGYLALFHSDPLPDADRHSLWMSSDVGNALDYYFVGADSMDGVVADYRKLTGRASMMPRWAYGFWQSRQRYETQDQLLNVVREYRKRGIPLDNIVLDWFYWPQDQWGSHDFDKTRFPTPQQMVDQVHAMNARIMISVWPKFYPNTDNAKAMAAHGWLYQGNLKAGRKDWVGPGYANTDYDAYSPGARQLYFQQVRDKLVTKGFDAWWMDATEPDIHSNSSIEERIDAMGPTASGPAAAFFNSYPLVHAEGMAEGLRTARPDVRPFILTRSGFGGLQRTSSALWSGDVAARWDDLRAQISAGVNISMAGIPNWTHDIGGFSVEDRYSRQLPEAQQEWRELNLRWFQFGAFSPLFRSHGEFPHREIYEISASDPAMQASMIWYDTLRYRLMPYIYTLGADTSLKDGSIMRGMVMDFAADRKTWDINDQYLFGRAFLVAPVTTFQARERNVYLPAGADWYDFNSGAFARGGQTIRAAAPYGRMPLFVRAGSIIPTGPAVMSTAENKGGPLVLHVFTGTDGSFSLYEDDGVSTGYAQGKYARVPMRWDQSSRTLTIGAREGGYDGMPAARTIAVRFYGPGRATVPDFSEAGATSLVYQGQAMTVQQP